MMTNQERNDHFVQALPAISRTISYLTRRVPAHAKEEATSELMMRALELTAKWQPEQALLSTFLEQRLRWALIDWTRSELGRRQPGKYSELPQALTSEREELLESPAAQPDRIAEIKEAIQCLKQLSEREFRAVTDSSLSVTTRRYGITESRVSQLRSVAGQRLADLGVAELLGLV